MNQSGTVGLITRKKSGFETVERAPRFKVSALLCERPGAYMGWHGGVSWHPNGHWIALGEADGNIKLLDLQESGRRLERVMEPVQANSRSIAAIGWSRDGSFLATCGFDNGNVEARNVLRLWTVDRGEPATMVKEAEVAREFSSPGEQLTWSPRAEKLALGHRDGSVSIWAVGDDGASLVHVGTKHESAGAVMSLWWDPLGRKVTYCTTHASIGVWSMAEDNGASREYVHEESVEGRVAAVTACSSPDGKCVLTCTQTGSRGQTKAGVHVEVWALSENGDLVLLQGLPDIGADSSWWGSWWSSCGGHVLVAESTALHVYNVSGSLSDGGIITHASTHRVGSDHKLQRAQLSPDGMTLVTCDADYALRVWCVAIRGSANLLETPVSSQGSFSTGTSVWSSDGSLVVAGIHNGFRVFTDLRRVCSRGSMFMMESTDIEDSEEPRLLSLGGNGWLLASVHTQNEIQVRSVSQAEPDLRFLLKAKVDEQVEITWLSWVPGFDVIAILVAGTRLEFWRLSEDRFSIVRAGSHDFINTVATAAWSRRGVLLTASENALEMWRLLETSASMSLECVLRAGTDRAATLLEWDEGGQRFAAYDGQALSIWEWHQNMTRLADVGRFDFSGVLALAWHPQKSSLALGFADGSARVLRVSVNGSAVMSIGSKTQGPAVDGLSWSPDGRHLAVTTHTRFYVWNIEFEELQHDEHPTPLLPLHLQWQKSNGITLSMPMLAHVIVEHRADGPRLAEAVVQMAKQYPDKVLQPCSHGYSGLRMLYELREQDAITKALPYVSHVPAHLRRAVLQEVLMILNDPSLTISLTGELMDAILIGSEPLQRLSLELPRGSAMAFQASNRSSSWVEDDTESGTKSTTVCDVFMVGGNGATYASSSGWTWAKDQSEDGPLTDSLLHTMVRRGKVCEFDSLAMQALVEQKWETYGRKSVLMQIWPLATLLIGFIGLTLFRTNAVFAGGLNVTSQEARSVSYCFLGVAAFGWLVTVFNEYHELRSVKTEYFKSWWNVLDVFGLVMAPVGSGMAMAHASGWHIVSSLTSLALWIKVLFVLRAFKATGSLVRTVTAVMVELVPFLGLMSVIVFGFANAFFLLLQPSLVGWPSVGIADGLLDTYGTPLRALGATYRMMLGDWDIEMVDGASVASASIAWVLFLLFTFIVVIVLLNLLIAILSDAYEREREQSEQTMVYERAQLLVELERQFKPDMIRLGKEVELFPNRVLVAVPSGSRSDPSKTAGLAWRGRIKEMKASVEAVGQKLQEELGTVKVDVSAAVAKIDKVSTAVAKSGSDIAELKALVRQLAARQRTRELGESDM